MCQQQLKTMFLCLLLVVLPLPRWQKIRSNFGVYIGWTSKPGSKPHLFSNETGEVWLLVLIGEETRHQHSFLSYQFLHKIMFMCKILHVPTNIFQTDSIFVEKRRKLLELFSRMFGHFNCAANYAELQAALGVFNQLVFWNLFLVRICSFHIVPSTTSIVFHFFPPIAILKVTYVESTSQKKLAPAFVVLPSFHTFLNFVDR